MKKTFFFLCSFFLVIIAFAQPAKEPMKVTDLLKVRSLGAVSLSTDGSKAVFTVTTIEPEGDSKLEYKYVTQLWLAYTDGRAPKQLTRSKESSSQPVFSPDGKAVLFSRFADGKPQLFLMSLDGGEAQQLTRYKYGASAGRFSPDGKKILFSSSVPFKELLKDSTLNPKKELPAWPMEKTGLPNSYLSKSSAKADPDGSMDEIRAYLENNAADKKAKVVSRLNFLDEQDVNTDMNITRFFIMDASPEAKPAAVHTGFYRFNFADFTPDGKQLLLSGDIDSLEHPDRSLENQIYLATTDGSGMRMLQGTKDKNFSSPRIAPSGKLLAFLYSGTSFVSIPKLAIMNMENSNQPLIEIPFDRTVSNLTWSDDGRYLYFTAQSNGGQPLYRVDMTKPGAPEQLTDFNSGLLGFDIAADKIAFIKTEIRSPFELYITDGLAKNAKQTGEFNSNWVNAKQLSQPEKHTFTNDKGMEIEYWVMKPANYQPGKKYPLLLEIHGGPSAMWGPGEASMWHEYQYFCSRGYGVVYCNPRGSGGYGLNFLRGNINDWGAGPTSDVLTALDKTIAEGWADTSKLLVTGGSYAGYLVAWIIAHDHRFAAACSQRGVYDLATFFGEGNAWRLVPNYFGGYPWEAAARATLERESPINYVQNITTPYIIFHGDNDRRTGFVQSEMLYKSLKVLGRPVEYVRHPGGTHELTRSGNNRQRIDQMLRTYEFFERWINK
ncbi:MAG: S9 family peptidase [Chitinophagaceae bacterium]|nr:S9 family peptidase [Chitinophagaceae bacterium]